MDRAGLGRLLPVFAASHVVLNVLHVVDHVRQGRALAPQVSGPGTAVLLVGILLVLLAWLRNPLAPYLGLVFGTVTSVGLVVVHLIPPWGAYSDSYLPLHLDPISYLSVVSLLAAGVAIGISSATAVVYTGRPPVRSPRT